MSLCKTKLFLPKDEVTLHGQLAAGFGMSQEVRDAFGSLLARLDSGPVTLLGDPAPDRTLVDRARRHGALEVADGVHPGPVVAIPMTGIPWRARLSLQSAGHELIDLTLPSIRRTRAMMKMMSLERRRILVVGHRDDAECRMLSQEGAIILGTVDDAMSLPFAPSFGILCQSHVGGERLKSVATALKRRHPDSSQVLLDTRDPALVEREKKVSAAARTAEGVVILADPADPSGRALYEAARLAGVPAIVTDRPAEAQALCGSGKHLVTSGLFWDDGMLEVSD